MTDQTSTPDARVFDLPHARVTLTPVGPGIEIEVWPKRGQSAYAVVDPTVAVLIARQLVELAAAQLAAEREAAEDDVIRGNQTLFMRGDEVEAAWAWTDPVIAGWEARGDRPKGYDPGSSGPEDALMLLHRDGRRWREIRE